MTSLKWFVYNLKYTKEEKVVNMAVTTIIKTIKSIHPDSIILVKVGKFYNVYGKDSYILSYFFVFCTFVMIF